MEPIFAAYSFADVQGLLLGPSCSIVLGTGSGSAEEGISFEALDERTRMTIGADGSGMHSLIQNRAARIMARFLKASPTNAALQQALAVQSSSSLLWGQNTLALSNPVTGDAMTASGVAFGKQPSNLWAKDANIIEWEFYAIRATLTMGGAIISVG